MATSKSKTFWIDGVMGSQLRDTQGEMLSVEGADISELEAGRGRWNDNHGKGFFNSIGRITEAKKIFGPEDCTTPRHTYYWEKIKAPYIYGKGFIYNDEDHMNAKAAAAILRNIHKSDCPLKLKLSVEGGVVARGIKDPSLLAQTKIHSCAITFTPANNATLVEPLDLDKSSLDEATDQLLIKSVLHLAEKDVPNFRIIQKAATAAKIAQNIKKVQKTLQKMKEEELEKINLRHAAAGAALATGLVTGGAPVRDTQVNQTKPAQSLNVPQHVNKPNPPNVNAPNPPDVNKDNMENLRTTNPHLWGIAQAESSGGQNLNHKTLESGQHKGQTAGGPWGMMPKTAAYVMKISKALKKKYPEMAKSAENLDANHKKITESLNSDPKLALEFAKTLYNHLKSVHGKDANKILHSWHYGITGTKKAVGEGKDLSKDEYVQKISNYLKDLGPEKKPASVEMNKALTAGYGGAGAPTDRTGGSVFQTEALDNGRHKFKYVTCEHCGNEQIHAKHQVKCRDCGRPWSLAKLMDLVGSN